MGSLFLKPDFELVHSTETDIKIASIAWGFQLGFTVLTAAKAGAQAVRIWRRTHRISGYVMMVWAEIFSNVIWGILTWLYLNAIIPPSFALFFVIVVLWCIELHCLVQIIVNRLSLLVFCERRKFWVKWGCFGYICLLNLSVFIIWMPAQLQYQPWHKINLVWDRVEKALFLIVDVGLNIYFMYLVKTRLISGGMTKYWPLFRFNVCMVFISVSMDVLIIAMMSMRNQLMYMQFHPVAYMIKLNIEMNMASLIGKIARTHDNSSFQLSNPRSGPLQRQGGQDNDVSCAGGLLPAEKKYILPIDSKNRLGSIGLNGFDPTMSEVADYSSKRYSSWITSAPPTTEPTEKRYLPSKRMSRLTKSWRKTRSDDTALFSTISFSGISKETEVTVVAEESGDEAEAPVLWPQQDSPV